VLVATNAVAYSCIHETSLVDLSCCLVLCSLIHTAPHISLSNLGAFDVWSYNSNHCYANNHMCCYSKASLNGNCCSCLSEQITSVFLLCSCYQAFGVTDCLLGKFAGLGFICSKICIRCNWPSPHRLVNLFSIDLLQLMLVCLTTNTTLLLCLCDPLQLEMLFFCLTLLVTAHKTTYIKLSSFIIVCV
jgi:hypothetical protein